MSETHDMWQHRLLQFYLKGFMMSVVPLHKDNVLYNIREDKSIYLGIPANILCIDDRLEPKALSYEVLEYFSKKPKLIIQDFTTTLYLGKIVFKKNKYGNLAPIYMPSTITESAFEGLNTFWLNELNPKAKKPFKPLIPCYVNQRYAYSLFSCEIDEQAIPYQKIHYYRSKDNIVLTKEQIISYFTELYKLNTTFIQNYIDSINQEEGIRANYLHSELYKTLLQQGILSKDMVYIENIKRIHGSIEAKLLALDYLKSTNQYNSKILFFDELFYAYLAWSLKGYDEHNLLFNVGAYKQTGITPQATTTNIPHPYEQELPKGKLFFSSQYMNAFYSNILPTKYGVGYIEGYELFYKRHGCLFLPRKDSPMPKCDTLGVVKEDLIRKSPDLPKSVGYKFSSPNQVYVDDFFDNRLPPNFHTYTPSPLGNYYFELEDNENTFVEYYQRIYPKLDNPPKGWSKEMMQKLELKLE